MGLPWDTPGLPELKQNPPVPGRKNLSPEIRLELTAAGPFGHRNFFEAPANSRYLPIPVAAPFPLVQTQGPPFGLQHFFASPKNSVPVFLFGSQFPRSSAAFVPRILPP
jgi:hypothetical protein